DSGELLGQVPSLPSGDILALSPNPGNKIWAGTSEGLGWVSLTTGEGNPHWGLVSPTVVEALR
ncbi:transcriptional regulator, partial [filamentous cyanobacterium CCP4]